MNEVMDTSAAPQHIENSIPSSFINNQIIHCPKNKISGRWICTNQGITVLFYYNGTKHTLPFDAVFTEKTLPWLKASAALMIESRIEELDFLKNDHSEKGGLWDG